MEIRYIKREDIDRAKYDGCVHYAMNHLVYGYSWYLDNVADGQWDVLVEDDYESVMPLPWNEKLLGYKQIYQPMLTQQLGIFSVNPLTPRRIQKFLEAIPKEYRRINISLNEKIRFEDGALDYKATKKPNLLLDLSRGYEEVAKGYNQNLKRKLKANPERTLTLTSDVKPEVLVEMTRHYHKEKGTKIPDALYHTALRVIYNALHRGIGFMSGMRNENGEIIAAACFIFSRDRVINLMNVSNEEGRATHAMAHIFDMLIRSFAGKPILLDFEGSSVEGIAQFYRSFGSTEVSYTSISKNELPWWLKMVVKG